MSRRLLLVVLVGLLGVPAWGFGADAAHAVDDSTDLALFDPATGEWHLRQADGSDVRFFYGTPGDVPLLGDWNCDGVDTVAMFRPSNGFVYLRNSNTFGVADRDFFYGLGGDVPLAGDWNGRASRRIHTNAPHGSCRHSGAFHYFLNGALQTLHVVEQVLAKLVLSRLTVGAQFPAGVPENGRGHLLPIGSVN